MKSLIFIVVLFCRSYFRGFFNNRMCCAIGGVNISESSIWFCSLHKWPLSRDYELFCSFISRNFIWLFWSPFNLKVLPWFNWRARRKTALHIPVFLEAPPSGIVDTSFHPKNYFIGLADEKVYCLRSILWSNVTYIYLKEPEVQILLQLSDALIQIVGSVHLL